MQRAVGTGGAVGDLARALLGVIDEVLGRLKSGKEANVSLVRRGEMVLAAKVYKDRETRSFKNNADYKEGRKVRNTRTQRAIDNGGKFGCGADMQAWKSTEADALYKLAGQGVRILACRLPSKSPWLNPIEPKWVHGKRAIVEPDRLLSAREIMERVYTYYGCADDAHRVISEKAA